MFHEPVKPWMPQGWSEFIGEANRPYFERLRKSAIQRRRAPPLLVIGPYGGGKSALAEFFIKCHACANITPGGDPCHICRDCRLVLPAENGQGGTYRRYQEDCHRMRLDKECLIDVLHAMQEEDNVAVFFDELNGLNKYLKLLLTVLPKFNGIFVAAIKDTEVRKLPPELFDRFRKVWLQIPAVDELVAFFCKQAGALGVQAEAGMVRLMVENSGRGFRTCLDVLQAAREQSPAVLDRRLVEEFMDLGASTAVSIRPDFEAPNWQQG